MLCGKHCGSDAAVYPLPAGAQADSRETSTGSFTFFIASVQLARFVPLSISCANMLSHVANETILDFTLDLCLSHCIFDRVAECLVPGVRRMPLGPSRVHTGARRHFARSRYGYSPPRVRSIQSFLSKTPRKTASCRRIRG